MKSFLLPLCLLLSLAACKRESASVAPDASPKPAESAATSVPQAPTDKPRASDAASSTPALQVTLLDGKPYDLAERRGKWVVVNFWATWCGPCLKEMPELSALDAMREDIEVIGLAYEEIETADMQAFLQEHPVTYPIALIDVVQPPKDFATPRGLPMTYLIAPDGKVAKQYMGPVTAHGLEADIAAASPGAAPATTAKKNDET